MFNGDCSGLKVLALSPHTDDTELAASGTLARLVSQGAIVHLIAFSTCQQHIPSGFEKTVLAVEQLRSAAVLGIFPDNLQVLDFPADKFSDYKHEIRQRFWEANQEIKPDVVFAPSSGDVHQDHATVHQEAVRIFKATTLLGMEHPWNCVRFASQCVVGLEEKHVEKKLECLRAYESQQHRGYMNPAYLKAWLRFRGQLIGAEHAECFEVIRIIAP